MHVFISDYEMNYNIMYFYTCLFIRSCAHAKVIAKSIPLKCIPHPRSFINNPDHHVLFRSDVNTAPHRREDVREKYGNAFWKLFFWVRSPRDVTQTNTRRKLHYLNSFLFLAYFGSGNTSSTLWKHNIFLTIISCVWIPINCQLNIN